MVPETVGLERVLLVRVSVLLAVAIAEAFAVIDVPVRVRVPTEVTFNSPPDCSDTRLTLFPVFSPRKYPSRVFEAFRIWNSRSLPRMLLSASRIKEPENTAPPATVPDSVGLLRVLLVRVSVLLMVGMATPPIVTVPLLNAWLPLAFSVSASISEPPAPGLNTSDVVFEPSFREAISE